MDQLQFDSGEGRITRLLQKQVLSGLHHAVRWLSCAVTASDVRAFYTAAAHRLQAPAQTEGLRCYKTVTANILPRQRDGQLWASRLPTDTGHGACHCASSTERQTTAQRPCF